MNALPWDDGIIGRLENFLLDRFPIGIMWARAVSTSPVSIAIPNAELENEWGTVKANLSWQYIGPSGLGFKTPLQNIARMIVYHYDKNLLAPSRFTPEGFTEWVMGTKDDKKGRKNIAPHPVCFINRDEVTRMLVDQTKRCFSNLQEYLSQLWDGYIEGYYTRSFQIEGNAPVYVTSLFSGSEYFYKLLDESFFTQGYGNRLLWIVGECKEPKRLPSDFFLKREEKDTKRDSIIKKTIKDMKSLSDCRNVIMNDTAGELWIDHQYKMAKESYDDQGTINSLIKMKVAINTLKLSMNYAASRFSLFKSRVKGITIRAEDVDRAIKTMEKHIAMWKLAIDKWNQAQKERRLNSYTSDRQRVIRYIRESGGKLTPHQLSTKTGWNKDAKDKLLVSMIEAKEIDIIHEKGSGTKMKTFYVEVKK